MLTTHKYIAPALVEYSRDAASSQITLLNLFNLDKTGICLVYITCNIKI